MNSSIRHIAMFVPVLIAAEEYYQALFGMGLIGRDAELDQPLVPE
jgi:catechol 2,3-dioxygenase-like lactoylglutathione lyase family enzyme